MVDFWVYDVTFLVLFTIFVTWFLIKSRDRLGREGIIFMYRTQVGVKAIKYVGDNYKKLLHSLKYPVIVVGYGLMVAMLWMLWQTLSIYILHPEITQIIKAPPIAPLIPYFPKLFGMQSFFPPFYFTYFIVALAIVAVVHEFSHGIFMRLFKIRIKSTGLVFLGPILGAFVEEEKRGFEKKKKIEQMTVLGAGVFANLVTGFLFYGIYVLFFTSFFTASGYIFNSYGVSVVPVENVTGFEFGENLTSVFVGEDTYFADRVLSTQFNMSGLEHYALYHDSPAVRMQMKGAIIQANDVKIRRHEDLQEFLKNKEPGDKVTFITENENGDENKYVFELGERLDNSSRAYLGVGHSEPSSEGVVRKILTAFMSFKDSSTYYKPSWDGNFAYFLLHLFWWVMIINFLVALFNMLPLGILDGGRFFYLTILGLTGSEKAAKKSYKAIGYAILLVFILLMFYWAIRVF